MKIKRKTIPVFILIFTSIIIAGCFGTRQISLDDQAIKRKENIIVYQSDLTYKLSNFSFNDNDLSGDIWKTNLNVPKSQKLKLLEIYVAPGFDLITFGETSNRIKIPYTSIQKIEKTRFRAELGLLAIPVWLIGGITIYYLSALFH